MFTGIVQGMGIVRSIESKPNFKHLVVEMNSEWLKDLKIGASISVEGVCLTVVSFSFETVEFDVIGETLQRTTLKDLREGSLVNIERAARVGDEIGGHLLSGHIMGTARIESIKRADNNCVVWMKGPLEWTKYLFPKGYIALNGASLTLVDVDKATGRFSVHLIPETLRQTTLGIRQAGELINVEIDAQTQTIVETIESMGVYLKK